MLKHAFNKRRGLIARRVRYLKGVEASKFVPEVDECEALDLTLSLPTASRST